MDNTINSLVSKTVGVTDQQIRDFLANSPSDAQIVAAMEQFGVSPTQLSSVVGMPEGQVVARIAATVPPGQTVIVGDTRVAPQYQTTGTGENQQIGGLENVYVEKVPTSDVNYKSPVGTPIQVYSPTGDLVNTIKTKEDLSFFGGLKEALTDPVVLAALGGAAYGGLLGGAGAATGAGSAFELANAGAGAFGGSSTLGSLGALGTTGVIGADLAGLSGIPGGAGALTAAETAALYGTGGAAATGLGSSVAGMGTGTGLTTAGAGGLGGTAGVSSLGGATGAGLTAGTAGLGAAGTGAGLTGTLGATNTLLGGAALGSTVAGLGAGALGTTLGSLGAGAGGSLLGSALGTGAGSALGTSLATGLGLSALGSGLGAVANQAGISDARNLINQYGTQAQGSLAEAYRNAQGLNVANRADLGNIYKNTSGNLYDLYNQQVGIQQPYQNIGQAGSQGLLANQDYLTRQFTNADLNANLAPNYAFQLQQGQMANQRAANMGGGSLGGNALQGLQRYTQDYAGGAYQNAFNNFNTQRQNIYGNLSNMANIGTTSAGQLANIGSNYGSNLGSLATGYGSNLTTGAGQGINAANQYGLNTAGLATGIGGALASNATQTGANTSGLLSNLGNTALLGSMLKAT
tara:strand:+ start:1411 stop:3309 length:1899 start_codon:yes stop_codon:yes gene_type:complete